MSGCSDSSTCPVCEGSMDTYTDWKPTDYVFGLCLDCGFTYYTVRKRTSFRELNHQRRDRDLYPLTRTQFSRKTAAVKEFID
jgi:Zn ribbon nucleic-acid-binding protein